MAKILNIRCIRQLGSTATAGTTNQSPKEGKRMLPVIFEPIQRLDPGRPLEALSLPGWLTCCVNSLGADYLNPEIPSELALSEEQRAAVAVRLDELALAEIA